MNKISTAINPIVVKEFRSRMRGARVFITLTSILVLLGIFSYLIYLLTAASSQYGNTPLSPLIGQTIFSGLAFLVLFLICIITPAVTAGIISGEKEKLTYEMLLVTPLHSNRLIWGKLVSSLSYIFLLIFAVIPMVSLVFIFGGVTLRDMLKTVVVLASITIMVGVLGLFFSALLNRSGRATVVTYLCVFFLLFAPLILSTGSGILRQSEPTRWLLVPSPISTLASALTPTLNPGSLSSIFWMFSGTIWFFGTPPISLTSIPRPLYHYSLPLYGLITLVLYLVSTRLILPVRRWRIRWGDMLLALIILIAYIGLVGLAFTATTHRYENINVVAPEQGLAVPPTIKQAIPDLLTPAEPEPMHENQYTPYPESQGGKFYPALSKLSNGDHSNHHRLVRFLRASYG